MQLAEYFLKRHRRDNVCRWISRAILLFWLAAGISNLVFHFSWFHNIHVLIVIAFLAILWGGWRAESWAMRNCEAWVIQHYDISDLVADIDLQGPPTYPLLNIYCGQYAFVAVRGKKKARPIALVPYDAVRWMYIKRTSALLGLVTLEEVCQLYLEDGMRSTLPIKGSKAVKQAKGEAIDQLISDYIVRYSPDVIVGYGLDKKESYRRQLTTLQRIAFYFKDN